MVGSELTPVWIIYRFSQEWTTLSNRLATNDQKRLIMTSRTDLNSWKNLQEHAERISKTHLRDLFESDPDRFLKFSLELPSLLLDFSKNRIDTEVMDELLKLAEQTEVEQCRDNMFHGAKINCTENRAVLHTALRDFSKRSIMVDDEDISTEVTAELKRIEEFVEKVRSGKWCGSTGKRIRDVVSIGVGGSNLGPKMVTEALAAYNDDTLRVHYVSNVDGAKIAETLRSLNPENVLFIVASKTFTTTETMTNATTALRWLESSLFNDKAVSQHFAAVTADEEKAVEFGILPENIYLMWDWVGGRFSLWSAIGLPIALLLGYDKFIALLEGAEEMDKHFQSAPLPYNAPVIMALMSLWNTTFMGYRSQAILPYDQVLHMFSAYMQQAEMESNGKSVSKDGSSIDYQTVPLIWGQLGIDGQHAFYQYLHQGMNIVPADFIGSLEGSATVQHHHEILLANLFAQTRALMEGVDANKIREELLSKGMPPEQIEDLVRHKVHQGNRPSNTLLLKRIDPKSLGGLIALYEHKIFVQGVLLDVCSFDQWGVELGKTQACSILELLANPEESKGFDASTQGLVSYYNKVRGGGFL